MKNGNGIRVFGLVCLSMLALAGGCRYDKMHYSPQRTEYSNYKPHKGHKATQNHTFIGVLKMVRNKNYCRPIDDGKAIEMAPIILPPNTNAPTEEEYNAAGWYWNGVEPPEIPEGKVVASTRYRYDAGENAVVADYEFEDAPPPSLEEYDAAMEDFLRQEREERGYTTREPDSYLTSNVPRWAQDAKDWVEHRDAVMEYALALINAVKRGERLPPTMEEFLGNMPKIHWTYEVE